MAASTSNYPAPGPGVKIDKVNPLIFGRFEYFPFAPPEIRNMIWELAIPRSKVITVKIVIKSCRTTAGSEQGCQDKHNLPFFTFAAIDDEFGVMMACRESRAFGFRVLPNALPTTYSQPAGIRYNPSISAIKILNFKDLLEEVIDKYDWFCPRSYRGQGITRLVIPCENIWRTSPLGGSQLCWGLGDLN
jgi:hypothetical protein